MISKIDTPVSGDLNGVTNLPIFSDTLTVARDATGTIVVRQDHAYFASFNITYNVDYTVFAISPNGQFIIFAFTQIAGTSYKQHLIIYELDGSTYNLWKDLFCSQNQINLI